MELQEKNKKNKAYRKSVQKNPTDRECLLILNFKPLRSYVKRKHSIRQRILLTVDIDILATSMNGNRKIMQSIRITSRPPSSRIRKWNQFSQFRWTFAKVITRLKKLKLATFRRCNKVQERQQGKDEQSCILVFVTIPSNNWKHQPRVDNSIPCMDVWEIYRDTEQPQEKQISQNESRLQFSGDIFSNEIM